MKFFKCTNRVKFVKKIMEHDVLYLTCEDCYKKNLITVLLLQDFEFAIGQDVVISSIESFNLVVAPFDKNTHKKEQIFGKITKISKPYAEVKITEKFSNL